MKRLEKKVNTIYDMTHTVSAHYTGRMTRTEQRNVAIAMDDLVMGMSPEDLQHLSTIKHKRSRRFAALGLLYIGACSAAGFFLGGEDPTLSTFVGTGVGTMAILKTSASVVDYRDIISAIERRYKQLR